MKKSILSISCRMLLLIGCSSKVQEKGRVQQIGIEDAFSKMDKKETFLLTITGNECYYCQLIYKMLNDTIEDYPVTIHNVKMDDSTTKNLYADSDLLEVRLEKPGTTPRVYYIKDGVVKDDITGLDEENPLELQEWVKKHNIEGPKQKQKDGETFVSRFKISLHPRTEGNRFYHLKAMRLTLFCPGHYDFAYSQVGIRQGVFPYAIYPAQIL